MLTAEDCLALAYTIAYSPCAPGPTDPVPRGLLTLCPGAYWLPDWRHMLGLPETCQTWHAAHAHKHCTCMHHRQTGATHHNVVLGADVELGILCRSTAHMIWFATHVVCDTCSLPHMSFAHVVFDT